MCLKMAVEAREILGGIPVGDEAGHELGDLFRTAGPADPTSGVRKRAVDSAPDRRPTSLQGAICVSKGVIRVSGGGRTPAGTVEHPLVELHAVVGGA